MNLPTSTYKKYIESTIKDEYPQIQRVEINANMRGKIVNMVIRCYLKRSAPSNLYVCSGMLRVIKDKCGELFGFFQLNVWAEIKILDHEGNHCLVENVLYENR